jgi:hypothetical protein
MEWTSSAWSRDLVGDLRCACRVLYESATCLEEFIALVNTPNNNGGRLISSQTGTLDQYPIQILFHDLGVNIRESGRPIWEHRKIFVINNTLNNTSIFGSCTSGYTYTECEN